MTIFVIALPSNKLWLSSSVDFASSNQKARFHYFADTSFVTSLQTQYTVTVIYYCPNDKDYTDHPIKRRNSKYHALFFPILPFLFLEPFSACPLDLYVFFILFLQQNEVTSRKDKTSNLHFYRLLTIDINYLQNLWHLGLQLHMSLQDSRHINILNA